jgi:phage terminase small subunit
MTRKQELFCDYYLISLNATEAARQAGYSKKSAKAIATENLAKPAIKAFIEERMSQKTKEIVAAQDEILSFLTKVVRGEIEETKPLVVGMGEGVSTVETIDVQVHPRERVRAAELLGKRYGLWDNKEDKDKQLDINIICDIPRPKDLLEN